MKIINYFQSENKGVLLEQIKACDWGAAKFLADLLEKCTFNETLGGWGDLYLLMDGDKLVSFATLAGQDAVRDEALTPWIGFVFTQPEYRGHHYAGQVLAHAEAVAASRGYERIYIGTDYINLYEKYGYSYQENRIDCWGDDMRVLYKTLRKGRNIRAMEDKYLLPSAELVEAVFTASESAEDAAVVRSLVEEIRAKRFYLPQLEMIMTDEADAVIGYAMFSRFHLEGKYENELLLLAPVAVKTELQRQHISKELIEEGFRRAAAMGYKAVIVEGGPFNYNSRGFVTSADYGITPHESVKLPAPECLMVKALIPGGLDGIHGQVSYHDYDSLLSGGEPMIRVTDIQNLPQVCIYQMHFAAPNFFPVDFGSWKMSFAQDTDGEGRPLFRQLHAKAAYDGDVLVGFIQYGMTAFGFDDCGEISADVSYPVIRALYFDADREDAGRLLLQAAMEELRAVDKVYAFFHYFGMSCFARHGKLFERYPWIAELLHRAGFTVEHENVYYSAVMEDGPCSDVALVAHHLSKGGQQSFDFILGGQQIGCCEVHYVTPGVAYLRWIYVNDQMQNRGVGTQCMNALKAGLWNRGITRLDTDTALDNLRAQHYYEKNGFTREGITRSYHLIK